MGVCVSDTFNSINTLIVALLWAPDLQNWIKWLNYIPLCLLGGAWSDLTCSTVQYSTAWPDLTLLVKVKACWLLLVAVSAGYIRYRVTSPSIAAGNEAPHKGSQSRRLGPSPG